jgi:hypothetical protein
MKTKIDFIISGDNQFDPNNLSGIFGHEPDEYWVVGDKIGSSIRLRDDNAWVLSSGYTENNEISDLLVNLFARIDKFKTKAIDYLSSHKNLNADISIAIYISDETPVINIQPNILKKLASIGATLDIDIILI